MSLVRARKHAERLVAQHGARTAPVDVDAIARRLGLHVVRTPLGGGISGLLVTRKGSSMICVEESHHENRQRFTMAHEIGHFVLGHRFADDEQVHVDRVMMRSSKSSEGTDLLEIEANQFAATLLMPEKLIAKELAKLGSADMEEVVSALARRFKVSSEAMAIRLGALGYEAT